MSLVARPAARRSVTLVAAGVMLFAWAASMAMALPGGPIQRLARNPIFGVLVVFAVPAAVVWLALWARTRRPDGGAFAVAVTTLGVMVAIGNIVAPALGWWAGPVFDGPLLPLAVLTASGAMVSFGLLLLLYRWLAARRPWLAKLVYALLLVVLIPVRVFYGDRAAIDQGVFSFGAGYTIWHDLLLAEALLVLPPLLYELFRRRPG